MKLTKLFDNNRAWSAEMTKKDPTFFRRLSEQQKPKYLWIGCSDSRVPANEIVGLMPGELFVHRNVANLVVHTDLNCLSVIQFAVDVLKVEHIIVCGHYGCGGVKSVLDKANLGLVSNWLRHLADVAERHTALLGALPDDGTRVNKLCELNILEQVRHVCESTILQDAWKSGRQIAIHGWAYSLENGHLREILKDPITSIAEADRL